MISSESEMKRLIDSDQSCVDSEIPFFNCFHNRRDIDDVVGPKGLPSF